MPAISVVIPVYNVELYLAACLDALLAQSCQDFEVIAVNDGSTDSSLAILNAYQKKISTLKVISIQNSGVSVARNVGAKAAVGHYVYFYDSDDCLTAGAFELMLQNLSESNLDLLFFGANSFSDDINFDVSKFNYTRTDRFARSAEIVSGLSYFSESIQGGFFLVSPCCYIARRELTEQVSFMPKILHEDNLYLAQLLNVPELQRIKVIDERLFLRRLRADSITTKPKTAAHVEGYSACADALAEMLSIVAPIARKPIQILSLQMIDAAIFTSFKVESYRASWSRRASWFRIFQKIGDRRLRSFVIAWWPELFKYKAKL